MSGLKSKRVMVAMSGGVDSSVAAALLQEAGYRVEGLMLQMWSDNGRVAPDYCSDAARVAEKLGIPFTTLDVRQFFYERVVQEFVHVYTQGLTPNPCLVCNRRVKFGTLFEYAREQGADYLATGHYAQVVHHDGWQLRKGVDDSKDQSYVLYALDQGHLAHILFPNGRYTKAEIRALAQQFELPVAHKPESQDICFLTNTDYREFIHSQAPEAFQPGPILDATGTELGRHEGLHRFTVGQRKGIGISHLEPLYVLALQPERNAVIVGPRKAAGRAEFPVTDLRWVAGRPPSVDEPFEVEVKIRYRARPVRATVSVQPGQRGIVHLEKPLRDIAPGQAAVFYHGETCLGGGTIERTEQARC